MKKALRILVSLGCITWLASCKSDAPMPPAIPPAADQKMPASPKPEVYIYAANVDKLNIREQPSKNGRVIAQLSAGDLVEGQGEISSNKEEITLRDIPYTEPYFKISTTTAELKSGWVFSAALTPVYAGPRHIAPELGRLSQLSKFLHGLNTTKLENGKKAIDFVQRQFAGANGTLADAAFFLLQTFLFRMELEGNFYALTERINWADGDYEAVWQERFDMNKYPETKALAANGFRLEEGEGMIFPVVDWAKLADFFANKVTPPTKEYILQNVEEQRNNAFDDGGLIVGLDTIAQRAAFWEQFNQKNPYFVRHEETVSSEQWLRLVMINGADNTPCFDFETLAISEDYKRVWAKIIQQYPGTKLAQAAKEMSEICASEGWKRTPKVEAFQEKFSASLQ